MLPSAPRNLECCHRSSPGTPGPAPAARSSSSTSSSSSVSSPSSSGGTASRPSHAGLQGRRAECVSVPGQRRRRSLRNKAKVGTTKNRPGLLSFPCALGFRIESCSAGCRGAGRLCADRRPGRRCPQGLRACCWFAFLLFEDPIADCGHCPVQDEPLQKTALENEAPAKTGKITPKHPCTLGVGRSPTSTRQGRKRGCQGRQSGCGLVGSVATRV